MSQQHPDSNHRPLADRLVSRVIDKQGTNFGDERERLHLYEAFTALTLLLNHITPLVGLIVVRIAGPSTFVPVFALVVTPILVQLLVRRYLAAHQVSIAEITKQMSPMRRNTQGLSYLLFILFARPLAWPGDGLDWSIAPFIATPLIIGLVMWRLRRKAERLEY